jgi:hypothetical protein
VFRSIHFACAAASIACSAGAAAQSVMGDGTRTMHALREEPHRAAVCVARNLDRHASGYIAQIRQGIEPALVEIQVRAAEVAALAHFLLAREGSTAVIWTTPDRAGEHEGLVAAMIEGC